MTDKPQGQPMPPPSVTELRGEPRIEGKYFFTRIPADKARHLMSMGLEAAEIERLIIEFLDDNYFYEDSLDAES